jgi:type III secretion system low calcium response chaperone LcrH/SycD
MNLLDQLQTVGKEFVEGGYSMAYMHYEKGQYSEAYDLFVVLNAISPQDKRLWMGFGAAAQMLKRYEQAIEAYALAAHLDEADPYPHFHAAECFYSINDIKNAWKALDSARTIATDERLKTRINLLRQCWYPKAKALAKKKD